MKMIGITEYLTLLTTWPSITAITLVSFYLWVNYHWNKDFRKCFWFSSYSTRNYNYWSSRGIKGPKPWPLFGNIIQLFQKPQCLKLLENYQNYGKIYGFVIRSTVYRIFIYISPQNIWGITTSVSRLRTRTH